MKILRIEIGLEDRGDRVDLVPEVRWIARILGMRRMYPQDYHYGTTFAGAVDSLLSTRLSCLWHERVCMDPTSLTVEAAEQRADLLAMVVDDAEKVLHNGVEMSRLERSLLLATFTFQGSCGCDGATDFGCPACTPDKTRQWKDGLDKMNLGLR